MKPGVSYEVAKSLRKHTLNAVPERGDGFDVLVQGDCESVHLVLVLHDQERVICCHKR